MAISNWLKMLDPRVLGKLALPIMVVSLVISGTVGGLVVALGKPTPTVVSPSLIIEEVKAFSGTNGVSLTLYNPQGSNISVDKAAIVTIREKHMLARWDLCFHLLANHLCRM